MKIFKIFKTNLSNLLFIFFIIVFSIFIFNNQDDLINLFNFNFLDLFLLTFFFIVTYLVKTKLNQNIYLTKNIDMSFNETLKLIINSTAGNLSTPFSLGTGYKFHYLKKNYGLTYSQNLNINIYYSLFTNLIFVLIILITTFLNFIYVDSIFLNFIFLWLLVFLSGIALLFVSSKGYKFKYLNVLNSFSLKSLNLSGSKITRLFCLTILLILINIFSHIYLFNLLNIQINNLQIISFVCLSGLANIIKFTPGNFGINESLLIISNLYHGLVPVQVIVVSLIFRFFSWINILIFYIILYFQKSKN